MKLSRSRQKYKYVKGIKCPKCNEKIWSRHRHDFRYCKCEYCYIDGGREYLRCGWGPGSDVPKVVRIRLTLKEYDNELQG